MREATRSKWQSLVARQVRSGKSVRQFCSEEGLSPATLFWWRSKLKSREASHLIPVTVVDAPSPMPPSVEAFELSIGNATLSIPHGFDAEELRRILQVLSC